ncbi:MAG: hypothetical protein ACTSQI_07955 [Candidatus Helarchaeota archaeon]
MKGIFKIAVTDEDEEIILERIWAILNEIHQDPDLLPEYVDFIEEDEEELDEFEDLDEFENYLD